jgi:hypothetical protein
VGVGVGVYFGLAGQCTSLFVKHSEWSMSFVREPDPVSDDV